MRLFMLQKDFIVLSYWPHYRVLFTLLCMSQALDCVEVNDTVTNKPTAPITHEARRKNQWWSAPEGQSDTADLH